LGTVAQETGILEDWHDARGFGFIRRPGSAGKIYVHMKSIGKSINRPKPGDRLSYDIGVGSGGRPAAVNVMILDAPPPPPPAPRPRPRDENSILRMSTRIIAAAVLLALLAANLGLHRLPLWVGLLYAIAGGGSYFLYFLDKRAAEKRQWREPERKLHLLDLTFGIIGGLVAQHVFRHKTYKQGFVTVTALITTLHVMMLGFILFGVYAPGTMGEFFQRVSRALL
jgi:uncharacterized membrane protein YsdA (DUF1294 family)/cold shock CspA family protein